MASWERKLDRAEQHLQALAKAIEDFIATDPYAVDRRFDADGADHVYFFSKFTDPPDCIGLLVGDAVHNLRTSLDHIVFSLAQKGADAEGVTMKSGAQRSTQFPVTSSTDHFEKQIGLHRLTHVAPEAKAVIERLQPYRLSSTPDRTWISILNALDATDKHRTIPGLGTVVSYFAFTKPAGGIEEPDILPSKVGGHWGISREIVRYRFREPHKDVDLEFNPEFTVAIDGAWTNDPADVVLRRYAQHICDDVVGPLARFF